MKKLFWFMAIFFLFWAFAQEGLSAFEDGKLFRVVHKQDGTIEIGTDLGTASSLIGGSNVVVGGSSGAFTNFTSGSIGNYYVTYFADLTKNPTGTSDVWVSGAGVQTSGSRRYTSFNGALSNLQAYYGGLMVTGGTVVGDGSNLGSFWQNIDKSGGGNIGTFAGFISVPNGSEANLADLSSVGYVDQYLYFFENPDNAVAGVQVAVIRTMANGSTIINPPSASIALVTSADTVTLPEGGTATFQARLSAAPSGNVTVTVAVAAGGDPDITIQSGSTLTFTTANWNVDQTVTLAAAEDADTTNGSAVLSLSAAGVTGKSVNAAEADNDGATLLAFVTNTDSVAVPEGGTATFQARLSAAPSGNVTVTVAVAAGGDPNITIQSGSTLTFTTANWNVDQTVTLAAAEDSDTTNGSALISLSAAGVTGKSVNATEADNDLTGQLIFLTNADSVTVPEGRTSTFLVRLNALPASDVTVSVGVTSGDADISVLSGSTLTFTPFNWDMNQTVTLQAAKDADAENGSAVIRLSAAGAMAKELTVTEADIASGWMGAQHSKFWNADVGNYWDYCEGSPAAWITRYEITGIDTTAFSFPTYLATSSEVVGSTLVPSGRDWFTINDVSPGESEWLLWKMTRDEDAHRYKADSGIRLAKRPLIVGEAWVSTTSGLYNDSIPIAITVNSSVLAYESVTVPFGTFKAYKTQHVFQISGMGPSPTQFTRTFWVVPYMGDVKKETIETGFTLTESLCDMDIATVFSDVLSGYWAYPYIMTIFDAGLTAGCAAGQYCPENGVTREQMAAFILRALDEVPADGYCGSTPPFSDVVVDRWSCKYIKRLVELGITAGIGQGLYGPEDIVTREQMAAFLTRALNEVPADGYCGTTNPFTDVSYDRWSCKYVKRLFELGITAGLGQGLYGPSDGVTRAQMAAFLQRAFLAD